MLTPLLRHRRRNGGEKPGSLVSPVPIVAQRFDEMYVPLHWAIAVNCMPGLWLSSFDSNAHIHRLWRRYRSRRIFWSKQIVPPPQYREILQPQTGSLSDGLPKIEWVNDLVWFAKFLARQSEWILDGHPWDVTIIELPEKDHRSGTLLFASRIVPMSRSGVRQICARRTSDHHVPTHSQYGFHGALMVITGCFGRDDIAGPRIVPASSEGIPHDPGEFTSNQYAHENHLINFN